MRSYKQRVMEAHSLDGVEYRKYSIDGCLFMVLRSVLSVSACAVGLITKLGSFSPRN